MKKLIIMFIFIGISADALAQWNIFVGGGANITTDCRKGANFSISDDYIYLSPPYHTEKFITKGFGGNGGIGCSYLLRKHHSFSIRLNYVNQQYTEKVGVPQVGGKYNPNSNKITSIFYDTYYGVLNVIQVPISYGYSINSKNEAFSFTPYMGVTSQFILDKNYNRFSLLYDVYIHAGVRFKYKFIYMDFSYARMLSEFGEIFPSIRFQTVNLSIGYVYTFKKKEKHPK